MATMIHLSRVVNNAEFCRNVFIETALCSGKFDKRVANIDETFGKIIEFMVWRRFEHSGTEFNRENVKADIKVLVQDYFENGPVRETIDQLYMAYKLDKEGCRGMINMSLVGRTTKC